MTPPTAWITVTFGDDVRAHLEEVDGGFYCGLPPPGVTVRETRPDDALCLICSFLAQPGVQWPERERRKA